ncbi:hypothetical protein BY996DRAFT_6581394 [Phakopsora pachyrhizi]|nr:hypothetical protein BY996DRAFT_6581394 [Phakopsora pachyrhizi]
MPPLATPINPSTFQKTSNSWNLNPNSHQKTSKSALPPTTYAELYETKTDCEECYSFCLKTGQIMNLGGFPRNWKNILSDQLKDENDTYDNDIYYAPYQHMTTEPLIDSTKLIIIVDDVDTGANSFPRLCLRPARRSAPPISTSRQVQC